MFNFLKNHNKRIIAIGIFITIMLTGAPIIVKSATTDTTRPTITAQPIAEGSSRTSGEMKLGTHPKFLIQDDTYITSIFYTWNKHFNENKGQEKMVT